MSHILYLYIQLSAYYFYKQFLLFYSLPSTYESINYIFDSVISLKDYWNCICYPMVIFIYYFFT